MDRAQLWWLASAASVLLLAAVILALLAMGPTTAAPPQYMQRTVQTFPGSIVAVSKDAVPEVSLTGSWFLDGHSPFAVALTCLASALTVPVNEGRLLFLAGGTLNMARFCNTFVPADVVPASWGLVTEGSVPSSSNGATLGLGRAQSSTGGGYLSPFLQQLTTQGYTSWTFTNRLNVCALYAGCPPAACVSWVWTALLDSEPELYVIQLVPTAREPWTAAVVDIGRWLSVFPGSGHQGGAMLLRTDSKASVPIAPGTYVADEGDGGILKPGWCLLGASAVAYQSACTLDLTGARLGLSTLAIGNIVDRAQSYAF